MHNGRAYRGAVPAVALINVLDDLLAPLVLEIDVDIGRLAAILGYETGEQKLGLFRIDRGDAEAEADHAVGGRAAALAENFLLLSAREGHDVIDGQKVACVIELGDQLKLVLNLFFDIFGNAVRIMIFRIALARAGPGQIFKMLLRGLALRHRLVRIFVFQFAEREGTGLCDGNGTRDSVGEFLKQPRHFLGRLDVALGIDAEPEARFGERAFLADAGDHVGEWPALRGVIEHIVDGDERGADLRAEFVEQVEPARFVAAMIMNAGKEGAAGSGADEGGKSCEECRRFISVTLRCERSEPQKGTAGALRPASFEARATRAHLRMMTPEQCEWRQRDEDLAFARFENVFESEAAFAFLGGEIALGEKPTETSIGLSIGGISEGLEAVDGDQTRADDELYFSGARFLIGAHHAGKGVAVSNADGGEPEFIGARHHFLRVRRTAQEGEIRRDGELGVSHHTLPCRGRG